jgi:hypothetical protein
VGRGGQVRQSLGPRRVPAIGLAGHAPWIANHFSPSPPPPPARRWTFHFARSASSTLTFFFGLVAVAEPVWVVVEAADDS